MGRILSNTPTPAPTALHNSTSQGSPDSAATPTGTGNFDPLLGVLVSVIIISFFVVGFSSGYIRRRIWGNEYEMRHTEFMRRRRMHAVRAHGRRPSSKAQRGLNPEIVAAIPLVPYKDLPADEREEKYFDCAVCLAVFDATDSLKLLPQCSHAFHSDCIDEWFRSHSTCPLCRVSLDPSTGKSSSRGGPRGGLEGDNADDNGGNPDGIRVPVDFDVVDMDGDGAISGFESQGETPTVSIAPTAGTSAGGEGQIVDPRSIVCMKTGEFSSFVPTIRVGISPPKAALASIRRSSSESTDLQLLRHSGYVVDSEGTQHHRNFQVHATAIHAQDQGHGLPTLRPVSLSGSSPNLRQISPEWKSLEDVESDSNS